MYNSIFAEVFKVPLSPFHKVDASVSLRADLLLIKLEILASYEYYN